MRGRKVIVTHLSPHLDEVVGIWLIRRFWSGWERAAFKFVPAGRETFEEKSERSDLDVVYVGVGGGEFDEHGKVGEKCAAYLVWEKTKRRGFAPKERDRKKAIERLVEWVRKVDTAEPGASCLGDFSLPAVLTGQRRIVKNGRQIINLGEKILDALLSSLEEKVALEKDWGKRRTFKTSWGRGVGVSTWARGGARSLAWSQGFVILVLVDPQKGFRQIWVRPGSEVDLTPVYKVLKEKDPEASWFLHHSKNILLSGDDVTPKVSCSKLSLEEIIGILKGV